MRYGDASSLLRVTRQGAGLTQAQLAARAGTTQSAISRLEAGKGSPSVDSLRHLLGLLGHRLELGTSPVVDGIDRDMIRANLSLDSADRVRRGLQHAEFVRRNRGAALR